MQKGIDKPKPIWILGLLIILVVSIVAIFVGGTKRKEPGEAFKFDISEYKKVDPALIRFTETGQIKLRLHELRAVASGNDGKIYVAGNNALLVFDANGETLNQIELTATPNCLAITQDGNIVLGMRSHVEVLDNSGTVISKWQELNAKAYITSVAVDEKQAYVADAGNRVVLRYDLQGALLNRIGEKDAERGIPGLVVPSPFFDVDFDSNGLLWVVNPGLLGIENYRENGDLVSSWYAPSMKLEGFTGCCNPAHIAFRNDGSLVTVEKGMARIKLYDATGAFKSIVMLPRATSDETGDQIISVEESSIRDVAVDTQNRVLVLDAKLSAVRIFEEKEDA